MPSLQFHHLDRFTIAGGDPCHRAFPGLLRLSSGTLLMAYREGSDHWKTDDSVEKMVRSEDGGASWSEPELFFSEPGWGCAAHHGPAQLSNGRILWPVMSLRHVGGVREFKTYLLTSDDEGGSWSDPLFLGPMEGWTWQNQYGRVQVLPGGRIFVLGGGQKVGEEPVYSGYFVSNDGGHTFPGRVDVARGLSDELDIVRVPDGRLMALVRQVREKPRFLHRAYSEDEGSTWSVPEKTDVMGQCPSLLRLPSGTILVGHRQVDETRPPGCTLSATRDGGESWELVSDIYVAPEGNFDCSYPSMTILENGQILCAYYTAFKEGNCDVEGIVFEIRE